MVQPRSTTSLWPNVTKCFRFYIHDGDVEAVRHENTQFLFLYLIFSKVPVAILDLVSAYVFECACMPAWACVCALNLCAC